MNESRFLFVLDILVLNILDEGRRTDSLYRMCVLSLIILLALRSTCFSYKAIYCYYCGCIATNVYIALQFILGFLTDVPKQHIKENAKTLCIQD